MTKTTSTPVDGDTRILVAYRLGTSPEVIHKVGYKTHQSASIAMSRLFNKLINERPAGEDYRVEAEARSEEFKNGKWRS